MRVSTRTSFLIFGSYDMKSLLLKFGHDISAVASKSQVFKLRCPFFKSFYEASEDIMTKFKL
jgi:hypothetical protein